MADRQSITPRMFAQGMYAPEDNPDYQALRQDPEYNRKLIDAALQASMLIPVGGAAAVGARAAEAAPGAIAKAGQYARSLEAAGSKLSPSELAVIQAKYPGRYINPQTGMPQSVSGNILTGRAEPAMGAVRDPFAGMIRGVEEAPANIRSYLTEAQPVVNPETGYQLQQIMPGGKFGPGLTDWTVGQRAARTGVAAAPLVAAGAMAPSQVPGMTTSGFVQGPPEFQGPPEMQGPAQFQAGAGRGFMLPNADDMAKYRASQDALTAARARTAPMPPSRELQAQARAAQPSDGILSRLFSGKDYQSNSQLVNTPTGGAPINWGSSDSAADFFRADKALAQMKAQQAADAASGGDDNRKRGGSVTGKGQSQSEKMPDPIHKALEIIHHLLIRH